jgi:ketosteroid isomerase-like protein
MLRWLPAIIAAGAVACSTAPPDDPTPAIDAMLVSSASAWNAGDLEGFLDDYLDDRGTTFMAGGHPREGFAWIRDNYAPRFAPGASRDSLRFEGLRARSLGADHAVATARYVLHRGDSVTSSGPFTLVLTRTPAGWKIIHDHTNADPE